MRRPSGGSPWSALQNLGDTSSHPNASSTTRRDTIMSDSAECAELCNIKYITTTLWNEVNKSCTNVLLRLPEESKAFSRRTSAKSLASLWCPPSLTAPRGDGLICKASVHALCCRGSRPLMALFAHGVVDAWPPHCETGPGSASGLAASWAAIVRRIAVKHLS